LLKNSFGSTFRGVKRRGTFLLLAFSEEELLAALATAASEAFFNKPLNGETAKAAGQKIR
jgi:hypothetical protein